MASGSGRRWIALAAAVAVIVAGIVGYVVFSGGEARAKQFATLSILEGSVDFQKGSGGFTAARDGMSLAQGDTIRTRSDGRAEVEYFDGSITRLDFDTEYTLEELATLENEERSKQIAGTQTSGRTWNRVTRLTDSKSRFETRTPTATAAVRGTTYVVDCVGDLEAVIPDLDTPPGSCVFLVLEDSVAVTAGGVTIVLQAFQAVVVQADGTIGEIVTVTPEQVAGIDWVNVNECEIDGKDEVVGSVACAPEEPPANGDPVAAFTPSATAGEAPLTVTFTDASTDPDDDPLSHEWDFGDSGTSAAPSPAHTYESAGTYEVSLTVDDGNGGTDSAAATIDVTDPVPVPDPTPTTPPTTQGEPPPPPPPPPDETDTTPPANPVVGSGPPQYTDDTSATFTFGQPGGAGFSAAAVAAADDAAGHECSLNGGSFEPCSSPATYPDLADQAHAFSVRAFDAAGNRSGATPWSWTVDTEAPAAPVVITGPDATTSETTATFTFGTGLFTAAAAPEHFECALDEASFESCESGLTYSELSPGSYTFAVRAADAAGNASAADTWDWTVTAPNPPPVATNDTAVNTGEPVQIDVLANDSGDAISVDSFTQPGAGTVARSTGDPDVLVYTPNSGFSGTDAFTYTIEDALSRQSTATVTIEGTAGAATIVLHWPGPEGRDLDTHVLTPGGSHVYYGNPCLPGETTTCWASLDQDVTNGPPGTETITIVPTDPDFEVGTYTIYVDNFSCSQHSYQGTGAMVTVNTATASQSFSLPAGNNSLRQWNVATVSLNAAAGGSPSAVQTYSGSFCGGTFAAANAGPQAQDSGRVAETGPQVREAVENLRRLHSTVNGNTAHLTWWPTGAAGVVRVSTEAFPEAIEDGEEGCEGVGRCDLTGLERGSILYVTAFRVGDDRVRAVEGVNALRIDIPVADPGSPAPEPTDDPPADDPAPEPTTEPAPDPEPSTEPEPELTVESSAEAAPEPEPEPEPEPFATPSETPTEGG